LADKSTRLILDALARAAAEPAGLSLYAQKSEPGLFPSTSAARVAADRAKADGLLRVVESEAKGRAVREVCALTDKGRQYLACQASPRQVLEDFVRVLEDRQAAVAELSGAAARMAAGLEAIRSTVEQVLPRLTDHHQSNGAPMNAIFIPARPAAPAASDALIADVKARLAESHAAAGSSQDCPLPDLYRKLESHRRVSVGLFHDALRQLHEDHQVYLHPWTGPLYALPEPAFALLVGHEVAYYASIR
jgi:DNA-binding PadR family transcriptional regulator